jgi:hypothetical protein
MLVLNTRSNISIEENITTSGKSVKKRSSRSGNNSGGSCKNSSISSGGLKKSMSENGRLPKISKKKLHNHNRDDDEPRNLKIEKLPPLIITREAKRSIIYKYKILSGNNRGVICDAIKRRCWWHCISRDEEPNSIPSSSSFIWEQYRNWIRYQDKSHENIMLNHIKHNNRLVSKKGLYYSLKEYCKSHRMNLLDIVPRTFFLSSVSNNSRTNDIVDDMEEFILYNKNYEEKQKNQQNNDLPYNLFSTTTTSDSTIYSDVSISPSHNEEVIEPIWILKPSARTNQGFGISVVSGQKNALDIVQRENIVYQSSDVKLLHKQISNKLTNKLDKHNALSSLANRKADQEGWIVQEYMDHPLLVSQRKFDVRCYCLVTHSTRNNLSAYWYTDAYIRTSSKPYSLDNINDLETHLTNDAVQKNSAEYGKFENSNKLSLAQWQQSIDQDYPSASLNIVQNKLFPEMKRLTDLSIRAAAETLGQITEIHRSFELFGYDYMVNDNFEVKLIEINTNPSLCFCCPLLANLITGLIEDMVKIAIDPYFPAPPPDIRTKRCSDIINEIESEPNLFVQIYP